jgi:hypothetical protein
MSTPKTRAESDPAKAEAFADRVLTTLNNGALCLMVSVGHRTGLFDVLSTLPPATSSWLLPAPAQQRGSREGNPSTISASSGSCSASATAVHCLRLTKTA